VIKDGRKNAVLEKASPKRSPDDLHVISRCIEGPAINHLQSVDESQAFSPNARYSICTRHPGGKLTQRYEAITEDTDAEKIVSEGRGDL
jgi:hypothetical protein